MTGKRMDIKMRTGVIITGGSIDPAFCLNRIGELRKEFPDLFLIAADRGLLFCMENGVEPDLIVGDFDSAGKQILEKYQAEHDTPVSVFNPEKDWTDTEIAVKAAMDRMDVRPGTVWVLGGTGTRLDHVLGNIQVLELALKEEVCVILTDPHNRIRMAGGPGGGNITITRSGSFGHYLSLVPWGGNVKGLTLTGMKYPLDDYTLPTAGSRGISNEILQETAQIRFSEGKLLIIESSD